ncbi:MAG: hypothetical protein ABSA79_00070 [Candidatus Bathyarchaeia archaeon]|jgi:hypothetical protein
MKVPETKQVDALMTAIDYLYGAALEKQSENTRIFFFDPWNLERWMEQEDITPKKFQSDEKHEGEPQSTASSVGKEESTTVFCPNGCGTKLVKEKFLDVFHVDGKPSEKDIDENFYCQKCGIRWLPQQNVPFSTEKAEKTEYETITVKVPRAFLQNVKAYLAKTRYYTDLNEFVMESLRERMLKVTT